MKFVFKYRRELAKGRAVYRPVVKISLKSTDGRWYTFTAYIDSGADVSMLSKGDAELLGIYKGEYWPLMGIGKTLIPAFTR